MTSDLCVFKLCRSRKDCHRRADQFLVGRYTGTHAMNVAAAGNQDKRKRCYQGRAYQGHLMIPRFASWTRQPEAAILDSVPEGESWCKRQGATLATPLRATSFHLRVRVTPHRVEARDAGLSLEVAGLKSLGTKLVPICNAHSSIPVLNR